ncbi:MAG: hypothetical protein CL885_03710 [Dehalococcoidia bacterium]|nr:hypothetical protein [Dehalococcoidia bacterium]
MATRNRVIYQSEALYVGQPEGDGYHYKAVHSDADTVEYGLVGDPQTVNEPCVVDTENWTMISKPATEPNAWDSGENYIKENYDLDKVASLVKVEGTLEGIEKTWYFEAIKDNINKPPMLSLNDAAQKTEDDFENWTFTSGAKQLQRVQSANYSFSINRQDVNQFGQLSRIDSVAIDPPTVSLDFSYYLTNGLNEALLGLNVEEKSKLDSGQASNFVKTDKQEEDSSGRNFFILTTPQGTDAVNNNNWDPMKVMPGGDAADQPGTGTTVPAVAASATITLTATGQLGNLAGGAVTIGDYTVTEGSEWDRSDSNDNAAASLAAAINALLGYTASATGGTITVAAETGGAAGNDVVLSTDIDSSLITVPGSLSGGVNEIPGGSTPSPASPCSTIALGNGFITQYTAEASVGGMPTASVTVEGLNLKSDAGFHNIDLPAVNNERGTPVSGLTYTLPKPVSGVLDDGGAGDDGFSCLRPGDIEMHLGAMENGAGSAGLMNPLPHGAPPTDHATASCHVQSFSIDVPMSRTPIQRLGTPWAYTRPLDFPLTITVSVSAIVADLKSGNVADQLFDFENHDLHFILREPSPDGTGDVAMAYYIRGAQLEGESFSSSIGDNKTVDITFTCQVGGAGDKTRGLMVAGSRGAVKAATLENFDPFKNPNKTQKNF